MVGCSNEVEDILALRQWTPSSFHHANDLFSGCSSKLTSVSFFSGVQVMSGRSFEYVPQTSSQFASALELTSDAAASANNINENLIKISPPKAERVPPQTAPKNPDASAPMIAETELSAVFARFRLA
jgi:hypothetical protein